VDKLHDDDKTLVEKSGEWNATLGQASMLAVVINLANASASHREEN